MTLAKISTIIGIVAALAGLWWAAIDRISTRAKHDVSVDDAIVALNQRFDNADKENVRRDQRIDYATNLGVSNLQNIADKQNFLLRRVAPTSRPTTLNWNP